MSDTIEQQLAAAHARNRDLALSIGNARAILAQHGFQQTPEDTLDVMVARAVAPARAEGAGEEQSARDAYVLEALACDLSLCHECQPKYEALLSSAHEAFDARTTDGATDA